MKSYLISDSTNNGNIGKGKIPLEPDRHFYWLDLIRFLAAFAVMACHFRGAFFFEYSALPSSQQNIFVFIFYFLTRLGFEAVLIFFVLSGILVGGKAIKRLRNGSFRVKDYIIDRSVRIMLPLIASMLFYLPIALIFKFPVNPIAWIGSLLSLEGILTGWAWETLWSLSYEVWFYITMLAAALIFRTNFYKFIIGIILLLICMMVFTKLESSYLFVWLLSACIFYKMPRFNNWVLWSSFVLSIALIVGLQLTSGTHAIEGREENNETIKTLIILFFSFTFGIFLMQAIQKKPKSKFLLNINKVGTQLAAFSYTLYLSHIPFLRLLEGLGIAQQEFLNFTSIVMYCVWVIAALVVAYLLYYLFERNTDKVKNWIKSKLNNNIKKENSRKSLIFTY